MIKDSDGNLVWRPTLKQERFLQIPLTVKEGFYAGALMAGKSDVLLMYPLVHGWHKIEQFKGLFLRRTTPELKREIIPRAKSYFRPFGATYNATDGLFTFPSGALYFMGHCENEDDVHNYDSMQPNYVAFDELTSFTQWIYQYITIERVRVATTYSDILPAIVRSASNPGNIGHKFVYERFVKPCPAGGKILVGRGGMKKIFIPATIDDNPYAPESYKKELDALPEAERKAKKYGDWNAYEGQVFDEFRDKLFPGEPSNAIHIVEKFDIPAWWPRICAIDWGFNAMCSVGWGAISPKKRIYVYRHQMFYGKKISEWAPEVKYFVDKENPKDIVICHSANQHRGDPHTILEQVVEELGCTVQLGKKDRIGGKLLVHEYLRWKTKSIPESEKPIYDYEFAAWLLRNKGDKEYKHYLMQFQPTEEERNIPKAQFFDDPDVKVICEALKACVYEKSSTDGKKKEDVAEFAGDDPYDMIRMLFDAADTYFALAINEQEQVTSIQNVVDQYELTKDMTQYYRQMRKVESDVIIQPVKRFHHAPRSF